MTSVNVPFLKLDSALQSEILLANGQKLYIAAEWDIENNATVVGKVAYLPQTAKGEGREVLSQLEVNDEVAFSYSVCADTAFNDATESFVETSEGSDYLKLFQNGKGDKIKIMALPGNIAPIWVGVLNDKRGEWIDGVQGRESDVNRWLSQFSFGDSSQLRFKNFFDLDGEEVWKCDYRNFFCKKSGDSIKALGDWIVCEPVYIDKTTAYNIENGVSLPPMSVALMLTDRAIVVDGGGFNEGDIVGSEERFFGIYQLWGKKYMIIKKRNVKGLYK